jgi:hypothetical protein
MDKTMEHILKLLPISMGTKEKIEDFGELDGQQLFYFARIHEMIPMIYTALEKTDLIHRFPSNQSRLWREIAIQSSLEQMYRTMHFLEIYDKLKQAGIDAIVVKGIVLRELYPDHYYRRSCDEDLYIKKKDFGLADKVLKEYGFCCENCRNASGRLMQHIVYQNKDGFVIELHTDLFNPDVKLFGHLNELFKNAFEDSVEVNVENVTIHTLSYNQHLIFLILHSMKHFMHSGFGIRQLCDIVMYCNAYASRIQWDLVWQQLISLGYLDYFINLADIGVRYLGMNQHCIGSLPTYDAIQIHSESLLEDIMESGIYGSTKPDQMKSRLVTIQAAMQDEQNIISNRDYLFKVLFPKREYMEVHYTYCSKYKVLLPVAWLHRFIVNRKEIIHVGRTFKKVNRSIAIGRKRFELMKEYGLIRSNTDNQSKHYKVTE